MREENKKKKEAYWTAGCLGCLLAAGSTIVLGGYGKAEIGDATLTQIGSFTRADGSLGQAGSFNLAQNDFVHQFVPIAISDAAAALPNLKGSGWARDLQEAVTISPELIGLLNQTQDATATTCAIRMS